MEKIRIRKYLIVLLSISITLNFYLLFKSHHDLQQRQNQNETDLWAISVSGGNLADKLEEILNHVKKEENEMMKGKLVDSWKIVFGEAHNIYFHSSRISSQFMEQQKLEWELLQYSLLRIDGFLYNLDQKFLEQGSYSINNEEKEKLKAIVTTYRKLHDEVRNESENPVLVINELTEQMIIIDSYYLATLENLHSD